MACGLVDRALRALGGAVAPTHCAWCGARHPDGGGCPACLERLPWNTTACVRCALPQRGARICVACASSPPPQDRAWTAFRYTAPVSGRIIALKFHAALHAAPLLAGLMVRGLAPRPEPLPELLVPVPLHASRLRRRGYNQALEIARPLARRLSMELAAGAVRRARATLEQTSLSAARRRRNVRGAFEVTSQVQGRHVALLDDVITTGATLAELARTVRAAGAVRVEAWAVARA